MRLAVGITICLLISGCVSEEPQEQIVEQDEPAPLPDLPSGVEISAPANNTTASDPRLKLSLELANMAYSNNLTRLSLVAEGPTTVTVALSALLPASYQFDDCAASSVSHIADGAVAGNMASAVWTRPARTDVEVRVAGTGVGTPDTAGASGSGNQIINETVTYTLAEGDELLIEMGGSDPRALHAESGPEATWRYGIDARGPVRVEPQPPRELHCGVGTTRSSGALHVHGYLTDAAVATRVSLEATAAGTLFLSPGAAAETKNVDVTFLGDKKTDVKRFVAAQVGTGELAIDFNAWNDALAASRWLMVDAYWPSMTS